MNDNPLAFSNVCVMLFGKEQRKRLYDFLRGDDGRVYFQMLSHDMKQLELQRLKAQAAKIPPKIRVYSFIMLVCFMLIYIVVILMQILTSMGGLFG